ncbi:MAG: YdeI/OmpD-associated family protein [Aeromicrobium sp.]
MTAMDDAERFHPETLPQWSEWLATHHDRGYGVWLVSWRRPTGRPAVEYEEAVLEALCHGWIDSTQKVIDDDRVMMWFAPRRPQSTWVRSNKERVARLEAEGRMQPAGRALIEAAKANGMWTVFDDAEAGIVHPELAERLAADPAAAAAWDALTPGARKRHLMDVALAKTPATVTKRVDAVLAALVSTV